MKKVIIEFIHQYPLIAMGIVAIVSILVAITVIFSLLMIFKEETDPSYTVPSNKRFKTTKNFIKLFNK